MTNDQMKQALMEEMYAASPSVWRNVIMTHPDGGQIEFEVGNISSVTTGTITTVTSDLVVDDGTSWIVTTFQELGADQPTAPDFDFTPPFPGDQGLSYEPTRDNTEDGEFESSSPLRDENDEDDTWGTEHDPGTMGTAETWFRNLRGDDEAPEVATFASPEPEGCPDCGAPGPDMVPCGGEPPEAVNHECPPDCPCMSEETMPF